MRLPSNHLISRINSTELAHNEVADRSTTSQKSSLPQITRSVSRALPPDRHSASEFMQLARDNGADTVEMNLEPSAVARTAREVVLGPATEVVPKWVGTLLSGHSR
jgi:NAD-dependent SIR2 family protein deacetylase